MHTQPLVAQIGTACELDRVNVSYGDTLSQHLTDQKGGEGLLVFDVLTNDTTSENKTIRVSRLAHPPGHQKCSLIVQPRGSITGAAPERCMSDA